MWHLLQHPGWLLCAAACAVACPGRLAEASAVRGVEMSQEQR